MDKVIRLLNNRSLASRESHPSLLEEFLYCDLFAFLAVFPKSREFQSRIPVVCTRDQKTRTRERRKSIKLQQNNAKKRALKIEKDCPFKLQNYKLQRKKNHTQTISCNSQFGRKPLATNKITLFSTHTPNEARVASSSVSAVHIHA